MVEIERVLKVISEKPHTVKEIADKLDCSTDAVINVLMLVAARKRPVLYVSVAKGGGTFSYSLVKTQGDDGT